MRILLSTALCAGPLAACDTGPQFSASVTRMATVSLEIEDTIVLNTPVSIDLRGTRREDLAVELTLTVTASSADVAEREAERIEIAVSRSGSEIQFGVGGIDGAFVQRVSGTYSLEGPRDMNARLISGGATVLVDGLGRRPCDRDRRECSGPGRRGRRRDSRRERKRDRRDRCIRRDDDGRLRAKRLRRTSPTEPAQCPGARRRAGRLPPHQSSRAPGADSGPRL